MTPTTELAPAIRLATASPSTGATREETLARLERLARAAAARHADFLLLPEAFLGGYPRGSDFGCKIGERTAEGRDEFRRYFRGAVDLGDIIGPGGAGGAGAWVRRELPDDGDDLGASGDGEDNDGLQQGGGADGGRRRRGDGTREYLERVARETGVFVVMGLVERAGGSLYCAVVYVCPRRGMIGKRRKVMPTGMERLIWAQGSPATLKAVSTTIRGIRVNLAAAICWENYMPLLRQSLYAQNVNLYFAPTADGRDTWLPLMRTIALEGRCFIVSSNMCVRESGHGHADNHQQATSAASTNMGDLAHHGAKQRRNSCMTEEGFEIALPSPKSTKSPTSPTARTRRRSTFDDADNSHEISVSGQQAKIAASMASSAVVDEDGDIAAAVIPTTTTSSQPATTAVQHLARPTTTKAEGAPPPPPKLATKPTAKSSFSSRGGSSIVSPSGEVLAGPQWEDDEGIIYADVDLEDCVRGRLDLDAAGSYSRNDSFKFSVEGLNLDPLPYYA
ncbi:carbon-nitrogen hydrolase [Xylariaceae sp. FL1651]|nr:carbon-nitrogen hydrolase [Xylariaceae sp. FL1651]